MVKLSQQKKKINSGDHTVVSAVAVKVKRTRRSVPRDSPPQRSSIYRGVTRHRWTGRYEAHLWDKNCWNQSQNKKGRQVYLGAYDNEEAASHAYDLAALKYWGRDTILNFPISTYQNELKDMESQSREEYIGSLRRKSSGFSRGVSKYRGVARHHHKGRWEARIGRVFGNKYLYLGTYATQEEAATAYDLAAIEHRGLNAVTNFNLSRYIKWLHPNNNNDDPIQASGLINLPSTNLIGLTPKYEFGFDTFLDNNNNNNNNSTTCLSILTTTTTSETSTVTTPPRPPKPSSALDMLLQSPKFKEMMEMTTLVADNELTTTTSCLEAEPPRSCSFPADIQTVFECYDQESTGKYANGDEFIFGDLNLASEPMLCEFDIQVKQME